MFWVLMDQKSWRWKDAETAKSLDTATDRNKQLIYRTSGFADYEEDEVAGSVRAIAGKSTTSSADLIAFDPTQVTCPDNRSNPKLADPCHSLAGQQHPPMVAISSSPSDLPAKTCPSPEGEPDSTVKGADYSMKQLDLFENFDQSTPSGKTLRVPTALMKVAILQQYSVALPKSGTMRLGRATMPSGSVSPNDDVEFTFWPAVMESPTEPIHSRLSDVLQTRAPKKYNLSPKAAAGILRRAKKRGKELPEQLEVALKAVASRA